jgi:hypothetical protein
LFRDQSLSERIEVKYIRGIVCEFVNFNIQLSTSPSGDNKYKLFHSRTFNIRIIYNCSRTTIGLCGSIVG